MIQGIVIVVGIEPGIIIPGIIIPGIVVITIVIICICIVPVTVIKVTVPVYHVKQDIVNQCEVRTSVIAETVQTACQVIILDSVIIALGV
jgi:hypothetical protein